MGTMTRDDFDYMVRLASDFDPYVNYIDNGRQWEQATETNGYISGEWHEITTRYGLDCYIGRFDRSNNLREKSTEDRLLEYLSENGIEVEPEKVKPKRIWTEEEIKTLIQTNDEVLYDALKKLYECQTKDEQAAGHTKEYNNKGFNGADSPFLSSVSEFLIKRGFLTTKQKAVVRKKLVKYNKQLTKIANS